jgi:putative phage-type endonuclease
MKIHDMDQYSDEWWEVRKGRLTASSASKLLTPTGKLSTQFKGEIGRLLAESMGLQEPEDRVETEWMKRGTGLEDEARKWLAVELDCPMHQIGLITEGDYLSASPDAVTATPKTGKTIIPVEIKCPKPSTHIGWILDGGLPKEHRAQVHFQLALTGAPFGYFMSYHPELPPIMIKVERDEYTGEMIKAMDAFVKEMKAAKEQIA